MVELRPDPTPARAQWSAQSRCAQSMGAPGAGRLNLLLTYGGWEDESWADRLPRLLSPMGVAAVRAGSGREATSVIKQTTLHAAVVDLTLPLDPAAPNTHYTSTNHPASQECGARVLDLLFRLAAPPPIIVVRKPTSNRDDIRTLAAALRHGVFAVVDRPVDLEIMLDVLRRVLRRFYANQWPQNS